MMERKIVKTGNAPAAIGPYSQAVIASGELIFTAGQIALAPNGGLVSGGVAPQTRQVIANLSAILDAAGSDLAHVVKTTVFLKDMGDFSAMNEVYNEFFGNTLPARSTVEVARLPKDVQVEIEAVAIVIR